MEVAVRNFGLPALLGVWLCAGALAEPPWESKIDPAVRARAQTGPTEFLIFLTDQADLRGAGKLAKKADKGAFVQQHLTAHAQRTQAPVRRVLAALGIEHRPFWVANMIWARGDLVALQRLARLPAVARIAANPSVHLPGTAAGAPAEAPAGIEWNITQIRAPEVWALGFTGQTVVVAGQDTGYQWDHPALQKQYRGWDGVTADHNYNWHDAIHSNDVHNAGANPCGYSLAVPCDDNGHGTHTMGTMVGDDGAGNQIGVAPAARWIGCRNMERGWGTPATYAECFEWFIAPTDLNGANPDPSRAPDVINNSWYCPPEEGCTDPQILQTVVENVRAAGIVVVASAGNSGAGCGSVSGPPAIYAAAFTVGATDSSDAIAGFSSRGFVTVDGSMRLKPNVSAPGVGIRSSVPGSTYAGGWSGTSMAGPHVAGAVALLLSAQPGLAGQPDAVALLLERFAVPLTSLQSCSGVVATNVPNFVYGWGRIDALATLGLGDDDGDGMESFREALAGTEPKNAGSVLRVTQLEPTGAGLRLTFPSVSNKVYMVETTGNLADTNAWGTLTNSVNGTGANLQVTDPSATTNAVQFYRIRLAL